MNNERYIYCNDGLKFVIKAVEIRKDSIIYSLDKVRMMADQYVDKQAISSIIIYSDGMIYSEIMNNNFYRPGEFKLVTNEINFLIDKTIKYFNGSQK